MTLCDICLDPADDSALLACVEVNHCADCIADCPHCQRAAADDHAADIAADVALTACEEGT